MDAKWVIIWLSVQITGLSIYVTKQAYDLGFERGKVVALTTFAADDVGTCFAKNECKEDIKHEPIKSKRN